VNWYAYHKSDVRSRGVVKQLFIMPYDV
jgi:hypothetical protein